MMLCGQSGTVLLIAAMAVALNAQPRHAQTERRLLDDVLLTLTHHGDGNGPDAWCRFSVEIVGQGGGMSTQCGPGTPGMPGRAVGGSTRRRSLTEGERATVQRLYASAGLFEGQHVGASQGGSHLPFIMLIARPAGGTGPAVGLVVSGNASFASGPRQALLDWLLQERTKLLSAAPSEE